ncbi:hypothetical protein [Actinomadura parmotrematis]|uniref:TlpA family protein disulfide reductase n=1 Tax=Actinomadura parmotrematis TaxID=2864039 RepID=A0ABS7G2Y3_9ACTN|nr:hypothetical protein [Actinomadura parmotrematis]MBW8486234.1 hypothetical protein [Actinomadura parmotrematis]
MPYLVAAVVLLGALCLVNLLLTLGILRRMRADAAGPGAPFALRPGARVAGFEAVTTADETVSAAGLSGTVGFFSAGCEPCHELLPRFIEHAREVGRDRVLAVVGGDDPALLEALAPVARVVAADPDGGPVARAFQNTWTPALYRVEDGRVTATGARVEELAPARERAAARG